MASMHTSKATFFTSYVECVLIAREKDHHMQIKRKLWREQLIL